MRLSRFQPSLPEPRRRPPRPLETNTSPRLFRSSLPGPRRRPSCLLEANPSHDLGHPESSSGEGSAAVRGSPQEAESTAEARKFSAAGAATAGGGARGNTTAASETTFRVVASRSVGVTGRRGAGVPVEVGLARGQPDQTRGAGEWGSYPGGEVGIGYDMPLPRLALKHTAVPQLSGKNPEFTAWTREARCNAK